MWINLQPVLLWGLLVASRAQVPTLEELSSSWIDNKELQDVPSISNGLGSVGALPDFLDASSFIAPPLISGTSMATMRLDGHDVLLKAARWSAFEVARTSVPVRIDEHVLTATSSMRMVPGEAGLLWEVVVENKLAGEVIEGASYAGESSVYQLEILLAVLARKVGEMGWMVSNIPDNPEEFDTVVVQANATTGQPAMVLHADKLSSARSGMVLLEPQPTSLIWLRDPSHPKASQALATFELHLLTGDTTTVRFAMAMGEEESQQELVTRLLRYRDNFSSLFEASRAEWEGVWTKAFTPHDMLPSNGQQPPPLAEGEDSEAPFTGYLPTLATSDEPIRRIYYMSALTLIATRRLGMNAVDGGRAFLTGLGNTCWLISDSPGPDAECLKAWNPRDTPLYPVAIGASAQFYWDTSLRALLTSLLDPQAMRSYIKAILSLPSPGYHESFGIDGMTGSPLGYSYSFNAHSIFTLISTYIRVTNDTAMLSATYGGRTVAEHLESLALEWTGLTTKAAGVQLLADYGGDPDNFLECVPSYIHTVPALQGGNVEMVSELANLHESEGDSDGAANLRSLARNLSEEMTSRLYVKDRGYWSCLYPDSASSGKATTHPVRHCIDFLYIARGVDAAGRGPGLQGKVRKEMGRFFRDELETQTWLRALSPMDSLNRVLPRPREILRPDHGITGAYDAWAALSVEALAVVDGDWDHAVNFLRKSAEVTRQGPFGQAHEVDQVTEEAFKTKRGLTRFLADNGGSFAEVIVRGLFGYHPPFHAPIIESLPFHGLESCLVRSDQPRGGFSGTLTGLRTPYGQATLSVGPEGVQVVALSG